MAQEPKINYLLSYNSSEGLSFSERVSLRSYLLNLLNRENWNNRILTGKK